MDCVAGISQSQEEERTVGEHRVVSQRDFDEAGYEQVRVLVDYGGVGAQDVRSAVVCALPGAGG